MGEEWQKAQEWETGWWGDCLNTYGEEEKQIVYAQKMGLAWTHNGKSPFNINIKSASVLDIGGGPVSLLLKCTNRGERCYVADPILKHVPMWVKQRYSAAGILPLHLKGEDATQKQFLKPFDEVWFYNCLQHTDDPALICRNARSISKIIRVFEWIDTGTNIGHPHSLTEQSLNEWLGGEGKIEMLNQRGLRGKCYYGVFKGDHYEV